MSLTKKYGAPGSINYDIIKQPYYGYDVLGGLNFCLLNLGIDTKSLYAGLNKIKYPCKERRDSLRGFSRTFGWLPKHANYRDKCSISVMERDNKKVTDLLYDLSRILDSAIESNFPSIYEAQTEIVRKLGKGISKCFTSGITTKNHNLKYHTDKGNSPRCISALVCVRDDCVEGGNLNLPTRKLSLDFKDGDVLLFDGRALPHGVTPLILNGGNRYSIVYYVLEGLWHCEEV